MLKFKIRSEKGKHIVNHCGIHLEFATLHEAWNYIASFINDAKK